MSRLIAQFGGPIDVDVPVGASLAVSSQGSFQVSVRASFPNGPDRYSVVNDSGNGQSQYVSPVATATTRYRIEMGGEVGFYEVGAGPANVKQNRLQSPVQAAPVALNATGAITSAAILGGIVTSTTAAAVAGTLPTGTVLDAADTFDINDSIEWSVIATGANAFTVTAAAGHTIVGNAVVATTTSGNFRTVKTAANTFVTYRIS